MYCATIGFFDGVHLGHQFMLRQLWAVAASEKMQPAVVTFNEHPQKVLTGEDVPLLMSYRERIARLKASGVEQIFAFNFEAIHEMTAEEFMRVLKTQCGVELLLMGYDQHFGSDGLTRFAQYEAAAMRVGLRVQQLPAAPDFAATANQGVTLMTAKGEPIPAPSSSTIRALMEEGDVSTANFLLGYPYPMNGIVVEGRHLGRTMGYPTANLELLPGKLIPGCGVYVCEVSFPHARLKAPFEKRRALLSIGHTPTVSEGTDAPLKVEVHIPDFDGDLYNRQMTVAPLRFLRGERKFESLEALKEQIGEDLKNL